MLSQYVDNKLWNISINIQTLVIITYEFRSVRVTWMQKQRDVEKYTLRGNLKKN